MSRVQGIACLSWGLMGFFIPFSSALTILFSYVAVFITVVAVRKEKWVSLLSRNRIVIAVLLWFGWICLSSLWSVAPSNELFEGIFKYRKLLIAIVIFVCLHYSGVSYEYILRFFTAGVFICVVGTYASRFGLIEVLLGPGQDNGGWTLGPPGQSAWFSIGGPENPTFGRNHITQGTFFVIASAICFGMAGKSLFEQSKLSVKALIFILLAFIFLEAVFFLQGRTGYFLAVILAVFVVVASFYHFGVRAGFLMIVSLSILASLGVRSNSHFFERANLAISSTADALAGKDAIDQGVRIKYWHAGLKVLGDSPLVGVGVGSFSEIYDRIASTEGGGPQKRAQPHSEFILALVHGGIVGLLLMLSVFLVAFRSLIYCPNLFGRTLLIGLLLIFMAMMTINSVIWDLAEGHFFAILLGAVATTCRLTSMNKSPTPGQGGNSTLLRKIPDYQRGDQV